MPPLCSQPPRMNSQGIAVQQFLTSNEALFAPFAGQDVHGGPPVVLVEGGGAGGAAPYFLGVFHFFIVSGGLLPCALIKRACSPS